MRVIPPRNFNKAVFIMESATKKTSIFEKPILSTKVKSANVKLKEMFFGYLLGPIGGLVSSQIFTVYLNTYWTDVLGLTASAFLSVLPLVSMVLIAIGNFVAGQLIERTRTKAGKARPYLLPAGILLAATSVLLYAVPSGNQTLQLVWIAIAYNLYYALAYPVYSNANSLLLPLSSRNGKQRSLLSIITNLAGTAATSFATIILPLIVPLFNNEQGPWIIFMAVMALFSLVCVTLQYYFTRERITEENMNMRVVEARISLKKQAKALVTNKFWVVMIIYYFIFQFVGAMQNFSLVYYCNFVLGTYNDGFTQTILGIVTGIPLILGMFFVWPLANKFGKRNCMMAGLVLSAAGCLIAFLAPSSWVWVIIGLCIKSLAASPAIYLVFALNADVLDNIEARAGFRCDGMSVSLMGIIMSVLASLCQGIFNGLAGSTGYVTPDVDAGLITQNAATQNLIVWCYFGFMMIGYAVCAVLLIFLNVEKGSEKDHEIILERQKQAALAAGKEWVPPEERLRREQEEADALAEKARLEELKARCEKKGLSFEEAEAEYQAKLAEKRAKAEAKEAAKAAREAAKSKNKK